MKQMLYHHWKNLKNNVQNRDRLEGWFFKHKIDDVIGWIGFFVTIYLLCHFYPG